MGSQSQTPLNDWTTRNLRTHSLGLAGSHGFTFLGGLILSTPLTFQSQLMNPNVWISCWLASGSVSGYSDSHPAVCRKSKARKAEDSFSVSWLQLTRSDPLPWRTQQEAPSSPSLEQLPRLFRQKSHNTAIEVEKTHCSMKNSAFSISVALKKKKLLC